MKNMNLISKISTGVMILVLSISMTTVSAVAANNSSKHNFHKQDAAIHAALEKKGFNHITAFSISKSDIHQTKYFVNFVNDGIIYDAYFTAKGELIEVYKMAKE